MKGQEKLQSMERLDRRDIFDSPLYQQHLDMLTSAALLGTGAKVKVSITHGNEPSRTNGREIIINVDDQDGNFYKNYESAIAAMDGTLFHECAHIRYRDFESHKRVMEMLRGGTIPFDVLLRTEDEKHAMDALNSLLMNEKSRDIVCRLYADLENILSDAHDENKLMGRFNGYASSAIILMRSAMWQQLSAEETLREKGIEGLSLMLHLILTYARFSAVPTKGNEKKDEYLARLSEMEDDIDLARSTDDYLLKAELIWHLMMNLISMIPPVSESPETDSKKEEEKQGASDKSASGNGSLATKLEEALGNQSLLSGMQSVEPIQRKTAKTFNEKTGSNEVKEADTSGAEMILDKISKEKERERKGKDKREESEVELRQIVACRNSAETINVITRHERSQQCKEEYEQVFKEIKLITKRTAKKVKEELRELSESSVQKHRLYGRSFDANSSFRKDGRFFIKKREPGDMPEMAIGILVDQSGSMSGRKIETARKASILLWELCHLLSIPVMVCGHKARGEVIYNLFADFECDPADRYFIMHMKTGGGNKDGTALDLTVQKLMKRKEGIKILFIISDGLPSAYDSREQGIEHVRSVIKKAKRNGVEIIACGIDDQENLRPMYGESFLNIEDIMTLPKTLAKIMRRRIVSAAM